MLSWARVATYLASSGALLSVFLHFLGTVVHDRYLAAWGIDADLFPKSTEWFLVHGYYSIWNGLAMLLMTVAANPLQTFGGGLALWLYVMLIIAPWNPFHSTGRYGTWLNQVPQWLKKPLQLGAAGLLVTSCVVLLLLAMFLLMSVPAQAGAAIGDEMAAHAAADFAKGCAHSKKQCTELLRDGTVNATGYVLSVSDSYVAYLDTKLGLTRVMPKEGLEFRATRAPLLPPITLPK